MEDIRDLPVRDAYRTRHHELGAVIRGLDEDLTRAIPDPDDVNWDHVGDLARAIGLALRLRDVLRGEVK